jgi:hypothetical protein
MQRRTIELCQTTMDVGRPSSRTDLVQARAQDWLCTVCLSGHSKAMSAVFSVTGALSAPAARGTGRVPMIAVQGVSYVLAVVFYEDTARWVVARLDPLLIRAATHQHERPRWKQYSC